MDNSELANVFGTLGAVCWSVQLLPQIFINWRRHNATGLQPTMMMFWAWAGVPLGVYNIVSKFNTALQIQPQILTVLSLITWIQCYYYEKSWSIIRCLTVVLPIALTMAGIELALVFALKIATKGGIHWPVTLMAVLAALFLAAGVLRHYYDIYIHRTVRGISFVFVALDATGDLTSIISIVFQSKLDILGLVIYATELILWIGVFACGGYYNLAPWISRWKKDIGHQGSAVRDQLEPSPVALHDLPSSTSVFRTPSSELQSRGVRHGPRAPAA